MSHIFYYLFCLLNVLVICYLIAKFISWIAWQKKKKRWEKEAEEADMREIWGDDYQQNPEYQAFRTELKKKGIKRL